MADLVRAAKSTVRRLEFQSRKIEELEAQLAQLRAACTCSPQTPLHASAEVDPDSRTSVDPDSPRTDASLDASAEALEGSDLDTSEDLDDSSHLDTSTGGEAEGEATTSDEDRRKLSDTDAPSSRQGQQDGSWYQMSQDEPEVAEPQSHQLDSSPVSPTPDPGLLLLSQGAQRLLQREPAFAALPPHQLEMLLRALPPHLTTQVNIGLHGNSTRVLLDTSWLTIH